MEQNERLVTRLGGDGQVEFTVDGTQVRLPPGDAGRLAANILESLRGSKQGAGAQGREIDWLHVRPTEIALMEQSPIPNESVLVLGFGPAWVGVSISKSRLSALGQGMVDLSRN
jgi:hypothetical protein